MVLRMFVEKNILITERTEWLPSICIDYYTVDYTIPNYIWTSAYRLVQYGSHLGTSPNIFRYCTVNCKITLLLYIQLFKENATFKLHFVLIVLPCKQQNVRYIRFLKHMHLPLKRTSS